MTAQELQHWLMQQYGAEKFRPGLERVGGFLQDELAQLKNLNPKIVTIAGTNGKGETAFTLAQMAREQGVPFVLWTSPHLHSVCERFQTNEGEISLQQLEILLQAGEEKRAREQVGLSYYEALWAAFLRWGLAKKAELWILEVGLGGRFDAVNLCDAQVVGLTSISRDHQEFLGSRYQQILREKLGVVRPNCTLISALESVYLREQTASNIKSLSIKWQDLFQEGRVSCQTGFSERNRRLAGELWRALFQTEVECSSLTFPGRGEVMEWQGHRFTFYGSHNPDGVRKLVHFLQSSSYNQGKEFFHQVWGAFSERPVADLKAMVRMLTKLSSKSTQLNITRFKHLKAASPLGWWGYDEGVHTKYVHEWNELIQQLAGLSSQSILVVGSYYFVGQLQDHLRHVSTNQSTSSCQSPISTR
jgi:dihydrofolate synthase/folylpolyglutamate synthase